MLEKKHLVFLAGATAPFAPPLCTALNSVLVHGEGECDGLTTKGEERGCIDTYSARHFFALLLII